MLQGRKNDVIHPDFRGNGYAPEAVKALINELFRLGFDKITAGYFEENTASKRVMEKCGMHRIGKETDEEYRGKTHHCLYYEISAGENQSPVSR